jgi:hypothetical protein
MKLKNLSQTPLPIPSLASVRAHSLWTTKRARLCEKTMSLPSNSTAPEMGLGGELIDFLSPNTSM